MALCQCAKEAVWLEDFLQDLCVAFEGTLLINDDNQGAISLAKNPVYHDHSKHIDRQFHYTCELVGAGHIQLAYCLMKDMIADVLTKALPHPQHERLTHMMGIM
jgi:hypothetical protein